MRVYVQRPDGTIVDIRVPGPGSPDVLLDICHRAAELLAEDADSEPVQR